MPINTPSSTGGPMDWFNALPKLSRSYAACLVATAACVSWGMPFPYWLLLDWSKVFTGLQVWRLVTHILVSGPLGFKLLFQVIWVLTYGSTLESSTYSMHPENYLFLFVFGTGCLSLCSLIMGPLLGLGYITYTGTSVVMMLLYVWSKEFPEQDIKLYGIVKIKGFWLPFAFMAITTLMGGGAQELLTDGLGVVVGHAWYFFTTLLPRGTGQTYLQTPSWVKWAADKLELVGDGPVQMSAPPQQRFPGARSAAPSAAATRGSGPGGPSTGGGGFQAFRGAGRRLGS